MGYWHQARRFEWLLRVNYTSATIMVVVAARASLVKDVPLLSIFMVPASAMGVQPHMERIFPIQRTFHVWLVAS